jgi:hypothetical protein
MSNSGDIIDLIDSIESGAYDDDLDGITLAVVERQRALARMNAQSYQPKDRVRVSLSANLRPRYILGAVGTVEEVRISKVVVRFDSDINDPYGKFAGNRIAVPANALERITDEQESGTGQPVVTEIPL